MKEKDNIKDLFSDKLKNYEAKVDPQMWTNISSQIGSAATSATTGTGLSLVAKVIIGTVVTAAVVTTGIILFNDNPEHKKEAPVAAVEDQTIKDDKNESIEEENVVDQSERTTITDNSNRSEDVVIEEEESEVTDRIPETIPEKRTEGEMIPTDEERITKEDEPLNQLGEDTSVKDSDNSDKKEEEPNLPEENTTPEEQPNDLEEIELRLPDVFTPNNDGDNDFLSIQKDNDLNGLKEFQVIVLNNRNQIVYQSDDPNFQWDGTGQDGMAVDTGVYVYFVTALDSNDNPVKGHQTLRIIR